MESPAVNDGPFECVLRNTGNVDTFIDEFFSFLARRTDFFLECPPEGGSYGFPKGQAEKFILSKFHKWKSYRHTEIQPGVPSNNVVEMNSSPKAEETKSKAPVNVLSETSTECQQPNDSKNKCPPIATSSSSDAYNGRATEKYTWSQTILDLDVKVPVKVMKGKEVRVTIGTNSLSVGLSSAPHEPIFEGKLSFPIVKDESYWNLSPGESINIWLQKEKERWWTALIEGEEPIDIKNIEAVRPMEELSEEEQMKIQELMWNQERKQQGLPTSDEMKMRSTLEKSWNLDGSPFKGQPFDPSVLDFNNVNNFQK